MAKNFRLKVRVAYTLGFFKITQLNAYVIMAA